MIIECGACSARFRLDEDRIKGRCAKIKCRKCGNSIVVMKDASPVAAVAETAPATSEPPSAPAGFLDLKSIIGDAIAPGTEAADGFAPVLPNSKPAFEPVAFFADEPGASLDLSPPSGPSSAEWVPSPSQSTDKDEVDLAFDQFLSCSNEPDPVQPTAPSAAPVPPASATLPKFEDMLAPETPDESSFLLSDTDALDLLAADQPIAPPSTPKTGQSLDLPSHDFLLEDPTVGSLAGNAFDDQLADLSPAAGPSPRSNADRPAQHDLAMHPTHDGDAPPRAHPRPRSRQSEGVTESSGVGRKVVTVIAAIFVAALIGGGLFLGFTTDGQDLVGHLLPRFQSLLGGAGQSSASARFEIRNVMHFQEAGTAGNMFVLRGTVANAGTSPKTGVRIHATILSADNQSIADRTVFAGNVVGGEMLKTAEKGAIDNILFNKFGAELTNVALDPGKEIPFMVIFFDAPDNVASYQVEAIDTP